MKKTIWYSTEVIKPKDEQKVLFKTTDNKELAGIFIEAEDMFFVGFQDSGDFYYSFDVEFWRVLTDNEYHELYEERKTVWLVNVSLRGQSLMYQFLSQSEQLSFVEEIKDRVDNVIYALDPCELVLKVKNQKKVKNERK